MIANLLSNALKYTDESGKISLKVEGEKDFAKITVTDTGSSFIVTLPLN